MKPFLYLRSCTRSVLALGLLLSGPLGLGALAKPPHPTRPASTPARVARPSTLDPVAYYSFTGNANDESGNGLHGTINGATLTTDRFGNANRAMSFDGNDNITFTGVPTTQTDNWTIATWVKLANLTQQDGVFVFNGFDNGSVGDGYSVLCRNEGPFGSQLFGLAGGVSFFNSGYAFSSTNTW
ncbi:MAG: hypothetical protein H7Y12_06685, partial [Sphingobacteriaceae bacterium]|nr:hypothetical protein [Cytophagaceae bacterium]